MHDPQELSARNQAMASGREPLSGVVSGVLSDDDEEECLWPR